ncbi:MAG: restriction endonuclease [Desulfobacterales bacterium]|nr:restriction endonuclease [Desulfobacterales bacterium]
MKPGDKFEQLTAEIFEALTARNEFESVSKNIKLPGPDGDREIDVLITGKVGPFDVKTIVECKDYKKKVNVQIVDALQSKMVDVNANKAVLVSRNGFSRSAIKKAGRLGISLCTAHNASDEKWKFEPQMPILITEHCCEESKISFIFEAVDNMNRMEVSHVSGKSIGSLIAEHWDEKNIEYKDGIVRHLYRPSLESPFVRINNGRKLPIQDFEILMEIRTTHYLGFFNDLESAKFLRYIEDEDTHIIFDIRDLNDYRNRFERFQRIEDVPKHDDRANFDVKHMLNPNPKIVIDPNA